jgi:hypothetical protein
MIEATTQNADIEIINDSDNIKSFEKLPKNERKNNKRPVEKLLCYCWTK